MKPGRVKPFTAVDPPEAASIHIEIHRDKKICIITIFRMHFRGGECI